MTKLWVLIFYIPNLKKLESVLQQFASLLPPEMREEALRIPSEGEDPTPLYPFPTEPPCIKDSVKKVRTLTKTHLLFLASHVLQYIAGVDATSSYETPESA